MLEKWIFFHNSIITLQELMVCPCLQDHCYGCRQAQEQEIALLFHTAHHKMELNPSCSGIITEAFQGTLDVDVHNDSFRGPAKSYICLFACLLFCGYSARTL